MIGEREGDRAVYHYSADQPIVTRETEHDMGTDWAWRFDASRCDDTCHHPMHAFHPSRGVPHLTWFTPGTPALKEVQP